MLEESHKYDDIINLPPPTSKKHPRMSLYDRAAQFSPFAALTGHDAAIKETARLTDEQPDLSEDTKENLNRKLMIVLENADLGIPVTITYFIPDERKKGGHYDTKTGLIKRIDEYERTVIFQDKTVIPIEQISEIESKLIKE